MPTIYSNDQPISPNGRDLLRRRDFASHLADAIFNYSDPESLVIGLFGGWGSGKSSILSFLRKRLETYPEGFNAPVIMDFNPWRVTSPDQIFLEYFKALTAVLDKLDPPTPAKRMWRKTKSLVDALDGLSLSNLVARYAILLLGTPHGAAVGAAVATGATVAKAAQAFIKSSKSVDDLARLKAAIDKRLQKIDHRIVVLLDDIDRLTIDEIRVMFQLVKSLADFNNVIYVMALDWNVVNSALSNVQGIDGQQYLKKIVQINCEIPHIPRERLTELFVERLNTVLESYTGPVDQDRFNDVYLDAGAPLIHTIRDINRVMNSFRFLFAILRDDVNVVDLLGITIIAVTYPAIYNYIRTNQFIFCDEVLTPTDDYVTGTRTSFNDILEAVGQPDREAVRRLVYALFPAFQQRITPGGHPARNRDDERLLRICAAIRFPTYFRYAIAEGEISQNEVAQFLGLRDRARTAEELHRYIDRHSDAALIAEVRLRSQDMPEDSILAVFLAFMKWGDYCGERERSGLFFIDTAWRIRMTSLELLRRLPNSQARLDVILEGIAEPESLATQLFLVNLLEDLRTRYNTGSRESYYADPLIDEAQLEIARQAITQRVTESIQSGAFFGNETLGKRRQSIVILACWRTWITNEVAREILEPISNSQFAELIRRFTTPNHEMQTNSDMGVLLDIFGPETLAERIAALAPLPAGDALLAEGVRVLQRRLTGTAEPFGAD